MMKLIIPGELTDLNTYIKKMNSNRFSGNEVKQDETQRVAMEARICRLGAVTNYPVRIAYHWYSKDRRKDIDNVAFSKKFINDGLVAAGVLENDSRKYVSGFSDSFYIDVDSPRVEVFITEAK